MSSYSSHADVRDRFNIRLLLAMLLGAGICGSPLLAHAQKNPLRDVFFGETHLHTSWSFDAYVFGNTLAGPEEAYQYALGKPIKHPAGYMVQLKRPLDFQAVTDHSEYMGTVRLANDPQSDLSKLPIAEKLKVRSKEDIQKVYLFLATSLLTGPIPELTSPEVAGSVWKHSRRNRRQVQPAGQVHDLRCLRMELDAGQSQPASQHPLQGFEEGSVVAI